MSGVAKEEQNQLEESLLLDLSTLGSSPRNHQGTVVTVDINSNLVSSKSGQMQLNPADPSGQSLASSEEGAGLGNLIRIHVSGTDKRGHQQDMRSVNPSEWGKTSVNVTSLPTARTTGTTTSGEISTYSGNSPSFSVNNYFSPPGGEREGLGNDGGESALGNRTRTTTLAQTRSFNSRDFRESPADTRPESLATTDMTGTIGSLMTHTIESYTTRYQTTTDLRSQGNQTSTIPPSGLQKRSYENIHTVQSTREQGGHQYPLGWNFLNRAGISQGGMNSAVSDPLCAAPAQYGPSETRQPSDMFGIGRQDSRSVPNLQRLRGASGSALGMGSLSSGSIRAQSMQNVDNYNPIRQVDLTFNCGDDEAECTCSLGDEEEFNQISLSHNWRDISGVGNSRMGYPSVLSGGGTHTMTSQGGRTLEVCDECSCMDVVEASGEAGGGSTLFRSSLGGVSSSAQANSVTLRGPGSSLGIRSSPAQNRTGFQPSSQIDSRALISNGSNRSFDFCSKDSHKRESDILKAGDTKSLCCSDLSCKCGSNSDSIYGVSFSDGTIPEQSGIVAAASEERNRKSTKNASSKSAAKKPVSGKGFMGSTASSRKKSITSSTSKKSSGPSKLIVASKGTKSTISSRTKTTSKSSQTSGTSSQHPAGPAISINKPDSIKSTTSKAISTQSSDLSSRILSRPPRSQNFDVGSQLSQADVSVISSGVQNSQVSGRGLAPQSAVVRVRGTAFNDGGQSMASDLRSQGSRSPASFTAEVQLDLKLDFNTGQDGSPSVNQEVNVGISATAPPEPADEDPSEPSPPPPNDDDGNGDQANVNDVSTTTIESIADNNQDGNEDEGDLNSCQDLTQAML